MPPNLDADIPDKLMEHYMEWDFIMSDSASAEGFHYLSMLDLGPSTPLAGAESLGELDFIDGASPGNDSRIVLADGVESLSCLQQRLLYLNISSDIRLVR